MAITPMRKHVPDFPPPAIQLKPKRLILASPEDMDDMTWLFQEKCLVALLKK